MEHQNFENQTIYNPKKAEKTRLNNTPKQIIPKKVEEQKIVKTDENNENIKSKTISSLTANFIKNIRNEKKFTQKELAQKSNLSLKIISDIERGGCLYKAEEINKISKVLGMNIPRN